MKIHSTYFRARFSTLLAENNVIDKKIMNIYAFSKLTLFEACICIENIAGCATWFNSIPRSP